MKAVFANVLAKGFSKKAKITRFILTYEKYDCSWKPDFELSPIDFCIVGFEDGKGEKYYYHKNSDFFDIGMDKDRLQNSVLKSREKF